MIKKFVPLQGREWFHQSSRACMCDGQPWGDTYSGGDSGYYDYIFIVIVAVVVVVFVVIVFFGVVFVVIVFFGVVFVVVVFV